MKNLLVFLFIISLSSGYSQDTLIFKTENNSNVVVLDANPNNVRKLELFAGAYIMDGVYSLGANYYQPKIGVVSLKYYENNFNVGTGILAYSWLKKGTLNVKLNSSTEKGASFDVEHITGTKIPLEKARSIGLHGSYSSFVPFDGISSISGNSWSGGLLYLRTSNLHWKISNIFRKRELRSNFISKIHADYVRYFDLKEIKDGVQTEIVDLESTARNWGVRLYLENKRTFAFSKNALISYHYLCGIQQAVYKNRNIAFIFGVGLGLNFF